MVPALLVLYVPLYFLGTALQSALGLAEGELLVDAGILGVLSWILMVALIAAPQIAGLYLGLRARELGEHRLGTIAVGLNALVGLFLVVSSVAQVIAG